MWSLSDRGCCHCNYKQNSRDDNIAMGKREIERGKKRSLPAFFCSFLLKALPYSLSCHGWRNRLSWAYNGNFWELALLIVNITLLLWGTVSEVVKWTPVRWVMLLVDDDVQNCAVASQLTVLCNTCDIHAEHGLQWQSKLKCFIFSKSETIPAIIVDAQNWEMIINKWALIAKTETKQSTMFCSSLLSVTGSWKYFKG